MGKGPEQTLLQGGHTEGPDTYERMLSITSHQRDAKGWEVGMTGLAGRRDGREMETTVLKQQ